MLPCFAPDGAATLPLLAASPGSLAAVLATLPEVSRRFAIAAGFSAKSGETLLLPGADGLAGALVGLGEGGSVLAAFASAAASLPEASAWHLLSLIHISEPTRH